VHFVACGQFFEDFAVGRAYRGNFEVEVLDSGSCDSWVCSNKKGSCREFQDKDPMVSDSIPVRLAHGMSWT
jgi:hypothetical protein